MCSYVGGWSQREISYSEAGIREGFCKGTNKAACILVLLVMTTEVLFPYTSSHNIWEERDQEALSSLHPFCRGQR